MSDSTSPPLMGRLAVHLKMITMDKLAQATREQARRDDGTTLGDILVESGMIDPRQLAKLVSAQKDLIAKRRARAGALREQPQRDLPPQAPQPPAPSQPVPAPAAPVPESGAH